MLKYGITVDTRVCCNTAQVSLWAKFMHRADEQSNARDDASTCRISEFERAAMHTHSSESRVTLTDFTDPDLVRALLQPHPKGRHLALMLVRIKPFLAPGHVSRFLDTFEPPQQLFSCSFIFDQKGIVVCGGMGAQRQNRCRLW